MVIQKIHNVLNENYRDCFNEISIISKNQNIVLVNLEAKEVNFDNELIPKLYKYNVPKNKKRVDTILPRRSGLYLVEFKDMAYNDLWTKELIDKANDSLLMIKDKLLSRNDSLSNKVEYWVCYGKKGRPDRMSNRIKVDHIKDRIHSDFNKKVEIFRYDVFKDWYYRLNRFHTH